MKNTTDADLDLSQFEGMDREALIAEVKRLREDNKIICVWYESLLRYAKSIGRVSNYWVTSKEIKTLAAEFDSLRADVERLTRERDEIHQALGFKKDAEHSIVLVDAKLLRPEMVKARQRAQSAESELIWREYEVASQPEFVAKVAAKLKDARAKIAELERDRERVDWLLANIPGSAFRAMGIVYSDGAKRADLDAAMQTNPEP